ncbi:MAG: carboxypeptidase-like regulatory domain-containing protein, partial [Prevotella sp.]|nr:carboxypeptidase-like regulatory domain-containing protein [Prevotella sp.]
MRNYHGKRLLRARGMLTLILIFMSTLVFAQTKTVTGTVVDDLGDSVIGAVITVKGSIKGTVTDHDGNFSVMASAQDVLNIKLIGYIEQNITVGSQTHIKIVLQEDTQMLDEVIVVGYGVQKKSDVTGAMVRVGEKEMKAMPVQNVLQAMQGKLAGV